MIQVKLVFKLDENFEKSYEEFIETLLTLNSAKDLYTRKSDTDIWTEKKLDKYYQVKAFFTTKELKKLDENFHKHLVVYGDERFGQFRNNPNKLKRRTR